MITNVVAAAWKAQQQPRPSGGSTMNGDERQGDANPIANREKAKKSHSSSRVTSGYNLGCRSEFLSPPCLFPAWSTRDRENRGDWKTRAALLRSSGQDPPPQPRLLEKQRRRWGRKGGGRWRRGGSRRGKGGGAEPTTRRPDSDVNRRCCGPSARWRGLGSSPPAAHARGAQAVRQHWEGLPPSAAAHARCRAAAAALGGGLA